MSGPPPKPPKPAVVPPKPATVTAPAAAAAAAAAPVAPAAPVVKKQGPPPLTAKPQVGAQPLSPPPLSPPHAQQPAAAATKPPKPEPLTAKPSVAPLAAAAAAAATTTSAPAAAKKDRPAPPAEKHLVLPKSPKASASSSLPTTPVPSRARSNSESDAPKPLVPQTISMTPKPASVSQPIAAANGLPNRTRSSSDAAGSVIKPVPAAPTTAKPAIAVPSKPKAATTTAANASEKDSFPKPSVTSSLARPPPPTAAVSTAESFPKPSATSSIAKAPATRSKPAASTELTINKDEASKPPIFKKAETTATAPSPSSKKPIAAPAAVAGPAEEKAPVPAEEEAMDMSFLDDNLNEMFGFLNSAAADLPSPANAAASSPSVKKAMVSPGRDSAGGSKFSPIGRAAPAPPPLTNINADVDAILSELDHLDFHDRVEEEKAKILSQHLERNGVEVVALPPEMYAELEEVAKLTKVESKPAMSDDISRLLGELGTTPPETRRASGGNDEKYTLLLESITSDIESFGATIQRSRTNSNTSKASSSSSAAKSPGSAALKTSPESSASPSRILNNNSSSYQMQLSDPANLIVRLVFGKVPFNLEIAEKATGETVLRQAVSKCGFPSGQFSVFSLKFLYNGGTDGDSVEFDIQHDWDVHAILSGQLNLGACRLVLYKTEPASSPVFKASPAAVATEAPRPQHKPMPQASASNPAAVAVAHHESASTASLSSLGSSNDLAAIDSAPEIHKPKQRLVSICIAAAVTDYHLHEEDFQILQGDIFYVLDRNAGYGQWRIKPISRAGRDMLVPNHVMKVDPEGMRKLQLQYGQKIYVKGDVSGDASKAIEKSKVAALKNLTARAGKFVRKLTQPGQRQGEAEAEREAEK